MPYQLPSSIDPTGPVGDDSCVVQDGDCIDSIAFAAGHCWQTIWNHPKNAALKTSRASRNILLPGDQLFIPPVVQKLQDCVTDAKHQFVLSAEPCMLRVRLLLAGKPRANEDYTLHIDDDPPLTGTTDAEGWIEIAIPPDAAQGKLCFGDPLGPSYMLDLGGMDPITEPNGLQKRLHNLGFPCEVTSRMDEATCAALACFQKAENLEPTGKPDRNTLEKLKKVCGC